MINMIINNLEVKVEEGWTIRDACEFYGLEIPTLCYNPGLSNYGGCRLCLVEIGKVPNTKLVSSCTYPCDEGLNVHTDTARVIKARKMMIELMLSVAPGSKIIQDLASKFSVTQMCGLCIRMCAEQMDAKAIGFQNRGYKRKISTPFDVKSKVCRECGGCMYICPACQARCDGPNAENPVCNACLQMEPTCVDVYGEATCWMYDAGRCGTCVRPEEKGESEKPESVSE